MKKKDKNEKKRRKGYHRQANYQTQPLAPLEIGIGMAKEFTRSSSLLIVALSFGATYRYFFVAISKFLKLVKHAHKISSEKISAR